MPVIVSPDFEVEIPEEIRTSMGIQPGQKLKIEASRGIISLIPIRTEAESCPSSGRPETPPTD